MIAETIIKSAIERNIKIATAESCTGGMIGAALTAIAGSSAAYEGGVVSYSNALKVKFLGVSKDTLNKHGAVSAETAGEMARGALAFNADIAVAVTGIAGPTGGTQDKPLGLVFIAIATKKETIVHKMLYGAIGRDAVREKTKNDALTQLHNIMKAMPLS